MKFVKGMIMGTLISAGVVMLYNEKNMMKKNKMMKKGKQFMKKMGIVLKRALYFITCSGKMMYPTKLEENYICQNLIADKTQIPREIRESGYQQISLFDTGLEENLCISSSAKTALMGF